MTHVLAAPRHKVSKLPRGLIPAHYFHAMEHNQQIASCCRHPENHDIEAFKSNENETAPDVYIFHCSCGNRHTRFCIGQDDVRPVWEVR